MPLSKPERERWLALGWSRLEDMMAARLITRAQRLVLARVDEALVPLGLNFLSCELLVNLELSGAGEMSAGRLCDLLEVNPPTVTRLTDRLVADGLVVRKPSESDRRIVLVCITAAGRTAVGAAMGKLAGIRYGMSGLSRSRAVEVYNTLADFVEHGDPTGERRPAR